MRRESLVIVNYLNIMCVTVAPDETETPLIVDANAMLPFSLAMQLFQAVSRRCRQVAQFGRAIQLAKLPTGHELDCLKTPAWLPTVESLSLGATKRLDHILYYTVQR